MGRAIWASASPPAQQGPGELVSTADARRSPASGDPEAVVHRPPPIFPEEPAFAITYRPPRQHGCDWEPTQPACGSGPGSASPRPGWGRPSWAPRGSVSPGPTRLPTGSSGLRNPPRVERAPTSLVFKPWGSSSWEPAGIAYGMLTWGWGAAGTRFWRGRGAKATPACIAPGLLTPGLPSDPEPLSIIPSSHPRPEQAAPCLS